MDKSVYKTCCVVWWWPEVQKNRQHFYIILNLTSSYFNSSSSPFSICFFRKYLTFKSKKTFLLAKISGAQTLTKKTQFFQASKRPDSTGYPVIRPAGYKKGLFDLYRIMCFRWQTPGPTESSLSSGKRVENHKRK